MIELREVEVRFGSVLALDNVDLFVPEGSLTGLIGRNGAGKSTSIRLMAGLLRPSSPGSRVRVHGCSPLEDRAYIVQRTGFLLSEAALFPYLTASETLGFIGEAYGLPRTEVRRRALELISFFDLEEAADRLADTFSTGMRKRLALAAAMIHAPPLLILDEPFESLDPLMVRSFKRLLLDYVAAGGTVLLSSHLIDAVEEICDRIAILEQARVVAAGPTEAVRDGIRQTLPSATLEDLYASLIPSGGTATLDWLLRKE